MSRLSPPAPRRSSLLADFARDLQPNRLLPSITTGLICGVINVITALAFAALLFAGELSAYLPLGIGLLMVGNVALCLMALLTTSHPSTVTNPQDAPAAILAPLIVAVLAALPATLGLEQKFLTIVMLVVGTTLLTGLCFILMGYFRLGALVRFLPYPVAGGFLAGTGWPLIAGGIGLMTDAPIGPALFEPAALALWLPGIVFAVVLAVATVRVSHPLMLPALIVAAVLIFYAVVWVSGAPVASLAEQGWLFTFTGSGAQWRFPFAPGVLAQVEWPVLLGNLANILPIILISVIVLLLNVTGVELIVQRDIDLNRELVVAGVSNLAGGLAGGMVGFHALSLSGLNHRFSGSSRITSLIAVLVATASVLLGPLLLVYIPRFVLAGLLAFLGVAIIMEWVVGARKRFPPFEYAIILVIALVSATVGFLQGMAVGLVAAVVLFVISYSRISVVKHALSGTTHRSRVTRGNRQRRLLVEQGERIQILQLQGYIFFGTANNLLEQVRARVGRADLTAIRFLILDFQQVQGLDSTATLSFAKMLQLAEERGITLVLTGLSEGARRSLGQDGFLQQPAAVRVFTDLDRSLEWCEAELLAAAGLDQDDAPLPAPLTEILARPGQLRRLIDYLERSEVAEGSYLIRQGDEPDDMYFIEKGQVTAQLEPEGQPPVRLETMRGGRVVGEIGFYLGAERTAAVRADEPTTIYRLSQARLEEIEARDPEVASTFHRLIVHLLSERVTHLIRAVDALLR